MDVPSRRRVALAMTAFPLAALAASMLPAVSIGEEDAFAELRLRMIADIEATAAAVGPVAGRRGVSEATLRVLADVPRHLFVPDGLQRQAYENRPLPIGFGQTISQPYIVAVMTDLLACEPGHKVFELGTGSGYQAAVLSRIAARVFSIEIIEPLARAAADRLQRLGLAGVTVRSGDGYHGWPEEAPFDRIIITAAASHIPPPLIEQLAPGGRMLIPVGGPFAVQELMMVEKQTDGTLLTRHLLPVKFVPLTGGR